MTLSEKLYSLRRKQGLSQEALAEKLDCSRQVISKWENGTTTPDGHHNAHDVCKQYCKYCKKR